MTKTFVFVILGRLPGLNDIIKADRSHWAKGNELKKQWTRTCAQYAVATRMPTFADPISISFKWVERDARRDLDNICAGAKFILDGMVLAGKIPNDTRKWVRKIEHVFPLPDKKSPRVEVTIQCGDDRE